MKVKEAFAKFEKPSVAIDTVILRTADIDKNNRVSPKQLQVLLVRDKNNNENKWHLPGTILRLGEVPIDAINRILETNDKNNIQFEQLYTVADNPLRDERGHIISIVYTGIVCSEHIEINIKDTQRFEYSWFWIEKPKNKDAKTPRELVSLQCDEIITSLKYDHHQIINDSIKRLQNKLMYTDTGFRFISEKFTIKELENTFNAINETIIPGFRRYMKDKIVGTGEIVSGNAFRPAELYKKSE